MIAERRASVREIVVDSELPFAGWWISEGALPHLSVNTRHVTNRAERVALADWVTRCRANGSPVALLSLEELHALIGA